MLVPAHRRSGMVAPPDNLLTNHQTQAAQSGPITIIHQHENVINLDGTEIARKTAPEVKEILESEQDRNRGNAQDQGLF